MSGIDDDSNQISELPPSAMPETRSNNEHATLRWAVWVMLVAAFLAFLTLVRVHTHLGVKSSAFDKNGREYVWRIWWRARGQILSSGSSAPFQAFYLFALVAMFALSALALWLALVAGDQIETGEPAPELKESP